MAHHSDKGNIGMSKEKMLEFLEGKQEREQALQNLMQSKRSKLEELMKEEARKHQLGATGKHPEGKLADGDQGEIQIATTAYRGKVILNFGKEISWIGFTPQQAREIANSLFKQAEKAEKGGSSF